MDPIRPLNKFETLVSQSPLAVIILGNPSLTDFELMPPEPLSPELEAGLHARDMRFLGCLGLTETGQFRSALAAPLDRDVTETIAGAFVQYVAARLGLLKGESVDQ